MAELETHAIPRSMIDPLSGMIFGLALSVGAITLVGNVGSITTTQDLLSKIAVFGFSFLILISVWTRYSRIMSVLPLENRFTIFLHTALLFAVSIEPFLLNILQLGFVGIKDVASQLYAIDIGVMMVIMGGFTYALADEERNLVPKNLLREYRVQSLLLFGSGAVFLFSISEVFWTPGPGGTYWRFYVWIIPLAISIIRRWTITISGVQKALSKIRLRHD